MISQANVAAYFVAFAVALISALVATPTARRVAIRFHILDHPGARKAHADPVPYLGGLGLIIAFLAAMGAGAVVSDLEGAYDKIGVILGGAAILAVLGLWDDVRVVGGWVKAVVEIPLALAVFGTGIRAHLFGNDWLDLLVTVVWVAGITNAVNFLDNMDGLTAGVAAIAAVYMTVLAALSGQFIVGALSAGLAGAALGFLRYNRPPARIFMGDTGALFLGFLLATISLELRFDNLARVTFFVPIAILGVPIFDTAMVSASRLLRRHSPLRPGLDHTSHRLARIGVPRRAVVDLLYLAAAACGWLGVVIAYAEPRIAYLLMGWIVAVGAFIALLLLRVPSED